MRKAWIWIAGVVAAGLGALLLVVFMDEEEARPSVWTNGTRICDTPCGENASTTQFPGFGSPGSAGARRTLLLAYRPTWKERVRWSVASPSSLSLLWADEVEITRPYAPAAGSDVRDEAGVVWWRCDIVK